MPTNTIEAKPTGDAQEPSTTVSKEDFSNLETKTKGGFAKVSEDMNKLSEELAKLLADIKPDQIEEGQNSLKIEMATVQT